MLFQMWTTGRRRQLMGFAVGALLLAAGVLSLVAGGESAAAREERTILGGRFVLTAGFITEPAYEGLPNGLFLQVVDLAPPSPTPEPAEGVTPEPGPDTTTDLKAEIRFGGETRPLALSQDPNDPTIYRAVFVPSLSGDYAFRIYGKLVGQDIDEEFRSGPNTFSGVFDITGMQFPTEVPTGQGLLDAFEEAEEDASRARTLGIAGILLGVLGLAAGGISVVVARRLPDRTQDLPDLPGDE